MISDKSFKRINHLLGLRRTHL